VLAGQKRRRRKSLCGYFLTGYGRALFQGVGWLGGVQRALWNALSCIKNFTRLRQFSEELRFVGWPKAVDISESCAFNAVDMLFR